MGKRLTDDIMRWTLEVNGNPARKELNELGQSTYKLEQTQKSLRLERQKLEAQDKKNTVADKELQAQMKLNAAQITKNKERMAVLRKEMGLNMLTRKELRTESKKLQAQLNAETPGTAKYKKLERDLIAIKTREQELTAATRINNKTLQTKSALLGGLRSKMLGYVAALSTAIYGVKQLIKGNIGLSDSFADVMKTSGLSRKEVGELYNDFNKLNTRTARKELLALAEEGGRLGYKTKDDLMAFVEVGNQIKVALGDDLGGEAEKSIKLVGKLTKIFKVAEKEGVGFKEAMLKTGSALNEVSANSMAQADFLIDIMNRMAGVTKHTDLAASSVIGYGSALDQLAQSKEVSGTTLNRVFIDMFKDVSLYADVAGQSTENFLQLLRTDANEAFLIMLEGLNNNNEGFDTMVKKMESLELDGVRATQVLTALAGATEMIRKEQKLANKALKDGTSLTKEYNIRNDNLAGSMGKIGEYLKSKFINSGAVSWFESIVGKVAEWTEAEAPLSDALRTQQTRVNELAIEMTNAETPLDRRNVIYAELKRIHPDIIEGIDTENISVEKLRLNLEKYNEQLINKIALQDSEDELSDKREALGKKRGERYEQEKKITTELNRLKKYAVGLDEGRGEEIDKIILSSDSLLEKNTKIRAIVAEINKEHKLGNTSLGRSVNIDNDLVKLKEEEAQLQLEVNQALSDYQTMFDDLMGKKSKTPGGSGDKTDIPEIVGFTKEEMADFWDAVALGIIKGEKEVRALTEEEIKKLGIAREKQLESEAKFRDELIRGSKTLIEQEQMAFDERLKKAGLYGKDKTKLSTDQLKALEILEQQHQDNIATINDGMVNDEIKQQEEAFNAISDLRKQKHNEELLALGNDEKAKKALNEKFNKEELERNLIFLEHLKAQLSTAIQEGGWEGLSLEGKILSSEEKEKLTAMLRELGVEISEINLLLYPPDDDEERTPFGMTEDKFDKMLSKIEKGIALARQLGDAFNAMGRYQTAKENAEFKAYEKQRKQKLDDLEDDFKQKIITEDEYFEQKKALEDDLDQKRAELTYKQSKREKTMRIFDSIINTAAAVVAALGAKPWGPWNFGYAATVGALGLIQTGLIAAEPVPQAYEGDYEKMPVVGKDDGRTYNARPTTDGSTRFVTEPSILFAERKPEWIIDGDTSERMRRYYPEAITMINMARKGITQFADGDYTKMPSPAGNESTSSTQIIYDPQMIASMDRFSSVGERLLNEGIESHLVYSKYKDFLNRNEKIEKKLKLS